ncbi:MAG TPA: class I SAM-dependent DNA methyltransferase [Verrucomicrobiae bacterium]|nr:class I SAM-dependent DNA methyltransferase [Verrucomicrobiae bacterium]
MAKGNRQKPANGSALGFEAQLWAAADKMRGHMDASEYKHVCLGLIFLKYISDAFEEKREQLLFGFSDPKSEWFIKDEPQRAEAAENRDEYLAANVFWLPPEARWHKLKAKAKSPEIGKLIDDAMGAIERENPTLKGVLPRDYARPSLDKVRLGGLVDIISNIGFNESVAKSKDVLGRVYEYFLGKFASAEGKGGGEFYTPQCVVQVLVAMLEPYKGRVFDPCCGSGGMFVQSEKFVEEHGGRVGDIAVYGQESNYTTWKLARMNLAIRGIDANLGPRNADSFRQELHPDLKADFILANPPFNMSDWGGENLRQDVRWKFGMPPVNNANYAWIQHFIHHLSPVGVAGFVMANGSMSTQTSNEGEIRKALIEADLVDCIVALPGQLFFTTQIPVCLWFLARDKKNQKHRDRRGHTLFIDARKMGVLIDRIHRELTADEISKIADTYHAWRSKGRAGSPLPAAGGKTSERRARSDAPYQDEPGFCKSLKLEEIQTHGYVLTPGRYVGAADVEDDGEPFEQKMKRLTATLETQFAESAKLEKTIRQNLKALSHA